MSARHTPGPWTFEVDARNPNERLAITGPNGETVVAGCGCCGSPFGDNLKHDAPLLSAATELLEALRDAEHFLASMQATYEGMGLPLDNVARPLGIARAAIAKATDIPSPGAAPGAAE